MIIQKKVSVLAFVGLIMSSSLCWSQSNGIDGVTSASGKLKIINGDITSTNVTITWTDNYNNGDQHKLKYGTTLGYGKEIDLRPFTKKIPNTTTIKNLAPATHYYAQFYRFFEGTAYTTDFQFTTKDNLTSILSPSHFVASINITSRESLRLVDMSGRVIALSSKEMLSIRNGKLQSKNVAPGIYNLVRTNLITNNRNVNRVTVSR